MFALLQISPPEAAGDDDPHPLDVIAVDDSSERLAKFLADYRERHRAACVDFDAWDRDKSVDWTVAHDDMSDELERKYQVCGPLISDMTFELIEVWDPPRWARWRRVPNIAPR
jgi:hypothetical protein